MSFLEGALALAVVLATPLALAAVGELVAERAGVLNLSIEGMMLLGAAVGFAAAFRTGSLLLGALGGALAGGGLAALHALVTVTFKANQVVSGLTLALLGTGLSAFIGSAYAGAPSPVRLTQFPIPLLSDVPFVGRILFDHDLFVYFTFALLAAVSLFLRRTRPGHWLRATGEAPAAADAVGIPVSLVRYAAVIFGGLTAGLAGTYFAVVFARAWTENITAGRGWIALALVIFATWKPGWLFPGAVFFGFLDGLSFQLQGQGVQISSDLLGMMPYVFSLIVLALVWSRQRKRHAGMPGALGIPYEREVRR